jgi:hypothetical protein
MLSSKALTSAAQKIKQFECINYFQACHGSISNLTLQTSANFETIEHSTLIQQWRHYTLLMSVDGTRSTTLTAIALSPS